MRDKEIQRRRGCREGSVEFRHRRGLYLGVRGMGVGVARGELGGAAGVGRVCRVEVLTEGGVAVLEVILCTVAVPSAVRSENLRKGR